MMITYVVLLNLLIAIFRYSNKLAHKLNLYYLSYFVLFFIKNCNYKVLHLVLETVDAYAKQ